MKSPPQVSFLLRARRRLFFRQSRMTSRATLSSPTSTHHGARARRSSRGNEIADLRIDRLAPAPAAEDAVVARAFDGQVPLSVGGDAAAQVQRGAGLADAGDVVVLAFDGQQARARDRLGRDARA